MDRCGVCLDTLDERPDMELIDLNCGHTVCIVCELSVRNEGRACTVGAMACTGAELALEGETAEDALARRQLELAQVEDMIVAAHVRHIARIEADRAKREARLRVIALTQKGIDSSYRHSTLRTVAEQYLPGYTSVAHYVHNYVIRTATMLGWDDGIYALTPEAAFARKRANTEATGAYFRWSRKDGGPWIRLECKPELFKGEMETLGPVTIRHGSWIRELHDQNVAWGTHDLRAMYSPEQDIAAQNALHALQVEKLRPLLDRELEQVYQREKQLSCAIDTLQLRIDTNHPVVARGRPRIDLEVITKETGKHAKRLFQAHKRNGMCRGEARSTVRITIAQGAQLVLYLHATFVYREGDSGLGAQMLDARATSSFICGDVLWVSAGSEMRGYNTRTHAFVPGPPPLVNFTLELPSGSFALVEPARRVIWYCTITPGFSAQPYFRTTY